MSKPIAVVISDVHYTPTSLPLAHAAMKQALAKAEELKVPLVDCGDLLDSKAIIRAECANALIELFSQAKTRIVLLVGNHTLVHEKSKEHALNFLRPYCDVVQAPVYDNQLESWLVPYHSNTEELQQVLNKIPKGSRILAHQGVHSANMGHYVQDKSALPKEAFADFRVASGHYHRAQDIKCGRPRKGAVGLFSYIGTPYTTSFSEANDGPKGFQILTDDGLLTQVPTNLRKHVIIETTTKLLNLYVFSKESPEDLVWLKVSGPQSELDKLKKTDIAKMLGISNFKLDKIPTDSNKLEVKADSFSGEQLLDMLIDNTPEPAESKLSLKELWREIV